MKTVMDLPGNSAEILTAAVIYRESSLARLRRLVPKRHINWYTTGKNMEYLESTV